MGDTDPPPRDFGEDPEDELDLHALRRGTRETALNLGLLRRQSPNAHLDEFRFTRYTPVYTQNPVDFSADGYELQIRERRRDIKWLQTITMYNEEWTQLQGSLRACAENVKQICIEKNDPLAWQSFAVCVVADGRNKAHQDTLKHAALLGIFDDELIAKASRNEPHFWQTVQCHLFESTIEMYETETQQKLYPPLQVIFAIKEHNSGKLSSHLWFFNAFALQLEPQYTGLLDVGTLPRGRALVKLMQCLDRNPLVAGVCGEIAVHKPSVGNMIVAAQHFEYKMSHILDKSLESMFGFITVLPGAFSAYRFSAIRERNGAGPLVEYFRAITESPEEMGPFRSNMYLAEDRILCAELVTQPGQRWLMRYVKGAVAETDVPQTLIDLMKQRRRWLNGAFFALLYSLTLFPRMWAHSQHGLFRKMVLTAQYCFLLFTSALNWFMVGNFYLIFWIVFHHAFGDHLESFSLVSIPRYLYLFLNVIQLIAGLGNRPESVAYLYVFSSLFYGILMYTTLGLGLHFVFTQTVHNNIEVWVVLALSIGVFFAGACFHGELTSIVTSFLQYLFMMPTFVTIFSVYSFCNTHDISWGTKGIGIESVHAKAQMSQIAHDPHGGASRLAGVKVVPSATKKSAAGDDGDKAADDKLFQDLYADALDRIDDIASAVKNDIDSTEAHRKEFHEKMRTFRTGVLLSWVSCNAILVSVVTIFPTLYSKWYILAMAGSLIAFNGLRFLGCILFWISHWVPRTFCFDERTEHVNDHHSKKKRSGRRQHRKFTLVHNPQQFAIGQRVCVHSLVKKKEFNDRCGVVVDEQHNNGWFQVRVDRGPVFWVSSAKLRALDDEVDGGAPSPQSESARKVRFDDENEQTPLVGSRPRVASAGGSPAGYGSSK